MFVHSNQSHLVAMPGSLSIMANPLLGNSISEKLSKANYAVWKAQIQAVLRGARLEGHLTGAIKPPPEKIQEKGTTIFNPEYEEWFAIDQHVLTFLLLSLSKEIVVQVAICTTVASAWGVIEGMYASGTRAGTDYIRISLATMKKGNNSIAEYVSKAHTLADEMTLAAKKIDDEELISYILAGLDYEYNPVVSSLVARPDVITIKEVYSQLLAYEQRVQRQQQEEGYQASANAASRGRGVIHGRFGQRRGQSRGRGREHHLGRSPSNAGNSSTADNRPRCQVYTTRELACRGTFLI
jgi:hypothetical protein